MADSEIAQGTTSVERPRSPALGLLSELSTGTYVSYSRALKELLSNAWDGNAHSVQIKIAPDLNEISILDDGIGMSEEDIRERFLRLGGQAQREVPYARDGVLLVTRELGRSQ